MDKKKNSLLNVAAIIVVVAFLVIAAFATSADTVQNSFWALVPPIIAIALALITKEVYSSLFIGVVTGALLYSGYNFEGTLNHIFTDGIVGVLSDPGNVGILIFLVILGTIVCLMNKAGGSAAFGRWASTHIKTRTGAQLATVALGILIFIDDYFNCLTVGSVMRPVTDNHKISRAKLAYLIDATAAPVCIIAPISSWAAAVSGFVEGEDGISLFVQAIPFNFYALITIVMMVCLAIMKVDFGPMMTHEENAIKNNDLFTTAERPFASASDDKINENGTVLDLVLPIVSLVVFCVIGMIYTGGFFAGETFVDAFANSSASVGLVLGSFGALVVTVCWYLIRRRMSFSEICECLPEGFKAMVPAILILTFAWSLKAMTDSLGAADYVAGIVNNSAAGFASFLPAIIFVIAVFLSFATGTSWGTFGILIPIVVACFQYTDYQMMIISMSACMAGSVCGDHCSPISDTTIMSSAGAQCFHMNHVTTQLPYAMTVAAISFIGYVVAGFTKSAWISLPVCIVLMVVVLYLAKKAEAKRGHVE